MPERTVMGFLSTIGAAIWKRLEPKLDKRLDELQAIAERKFDDAVENMLAMLAEQLPAMAAELSRSAVKTVLDATQVDEAVGEATARLDEFFDRIPLPKLPFGLGGDRR